MKGSTILLVVVLIGFTGCDLREREEALQMREAALNEREQQLLLKEKTLQVKEEELSKRQQLLDSTRNSDTTHLVNPALVGNWSVKMTCTEATCPGWAVGDTKTEQWNFTYTQSTLVVKAMASDKLVRVYSGFYTGSTVELVEEKPVSDTLNTTKTVIRLHFVDDTHLEGQREIIHQSECRVVYGLQLQKINP